MLWEWLLPKASPEGIIETTVSAIAHGCGVTDERAEVILKRFAGPDRRSRTPDREGRRVIVHREPEFHIVLVNYEKYRTKDHTAAERMRRMRARRKAEDAVTVTRHVTQARSHKPEASTETEVAAAAVVVEPERARATQATLEDVGLPGVEPAKGDQARKVGEVYLRTFNTIFGRNVRALAVQADIVDRIRARLAEGLEPELLISLPILARAQGQETGDILSRTPTVLLRTGKHGRRDGTGRTVGATDHAREFAGRLDQITLPPRLVNAAGVAGVLVWLQAQGVGIRGTGS